jgi:hypothetical protein
VAGWRVLVDASARRLCLSGLVALMIAPENKIGADWSFSKIEPEFLVERGVKLALRYIGGSPSKRLTVLERDRLFAAGIAILLGWEQSAESPLEGATEGAKHGADAKQQAQALGYPTDMPILVAVDTDITSQTVGAAEAYVRKFAEKCKPFPIGLYGDTDIIKALQDLSQINWLPNASSWSNAAAPERQLVHIRQRKTVKVDLDGDGEPDIAFDPNDVEKPVRAWFPGSGPVDDHDQKDNDMAKTQLPATAVLVSIPGLANAFLVGVGPALHLDPVLFNHYKNVVGLPLVQVSEHDQLLKSLAFQSGTEILGINAVPVG